MLIAGASAYLLHGRPFRDDRFLCDLFVQSHGIVRAVWRAGRRRAPLSPFQPLEIDAQGRQGGLITLRRAESCAAAAPLQGRGAMLGLYLNELLIRLLPPWQAEAQLYQHYTLLVQALVNPEDDEWRLRHFESHLLECLGFTLDWQHDSEGRALLAETSYHWQEERGWYPASAGLPGSLIAELAADVRNEQTRRAAKWLNRQRIDALLAGRALRSRELFRG